MKGNFEKLINSDKLVLIDFYAEWCGPCKMQTPILKEVSREMGDKVRIVKIDIDRNQQIGQKYQIRGVPTLAMFRHGKEVWRQSGVQTKQNLMNAINQYA